MTVLSFPVSPPTNVFHMGLGCLLGRVRLVSRGPARPFLYLLQNFAQV
jgi:hypothetical protein